MLLKQSMVDALNKQVIEEFSASAQYIAIALHFDSETLPELAKYFHAQATEEHGHAMKLLQLYHRCRWPWPSCRLPENLKITLKPLKNRCNWRSTKS